VRASSKSSLYQQTSEEHNGFWGGKQLYHYFGERRLDARDNGFKADTLWHASGNSCLGAKYEIPGSANCAREVII
jgi:hypothetical protein